MLGTCCVFGATGQTGSVRPLSQPPSPCIGVCVSAFVTAAQEVRGLVHAGERKHTNRPWCGSFSAAASSAQRESWPTATRACRPTAGHARTCSSRGRRPWRRSRPRDPAKSLASTPFLSTSAPRKAKLDSRFASTCAGARAPLQGGQGNRGVVAST